MKIRKLQLVSFAFLFVIVSIFGILHIYKAINVYRLDSPAYLAIVIDDFGYGGEGTDEMLALPIKFTAAILPFSESSKEDGQKAVDAGKEVIIHMPMEPKLGTSSFFGENIIKTTMTQEEISNLIHRALEILPESTGINNHMGSKVTEDEKTLASIIEIANSLGLIFLDSKTTQNTKVPEVCEELNTLCLQRDIFIDSTNNIEVVKKNLRDAANLALEKGHALVIGHVGPEGGLVTVNAIAELAPEFMAEGIEFVTLSEYAEIVKNEKDGIFAFLNI
ncbi:MAG: divergent polysaccharide deacetylase family protein [Lachnospiraceae bacterium]|nr:divergent polysaccharide deacetylase family protein [Lachnospiraceae bacterium]